MSKIGLLTKHQYLRITRSVKKSRINRLFDRKSFVSWLQYIARPFHHVGLSMKTSAALAIIAALLTAPLPGGAQTKIVGGTKATGGDYPWMAAIANTTGGSLFDRQFCGGSLIAPDWILTAAHCMEGEVAEGVQILVNFTDLDDSAGAEIRGVKGIYIHPSFTDIKGDLYNDVALILLDAPINTVTPIEVATSPVAVTVGAAVRAIGWGDTKGSPRYPNELQEVDLAIESIITARRVYGVSNLDNRHLAAAANGKDTCAGDSGGPLFDIDGGGGGINPLLVGLTSYGLGCAVRNVPGIYTNVGNYIAWINAFLAQPTDVDAVASVSGRGIAIPNGTFSTSTLAGTNFGRRVRPGRTVVRQFSISNASGSLPLSVPFARTSGKSFSVRSSPPYVMGGSSGVISVAYRAPFSYRRGRSKTVLSIRTNDPTAISYYFRIQAKY
jgi:secreted trypsin-like serine protease